MFPKLWYQPRKSLLASMHYQAKTFAELRLLLERYVKLREKRISVKKLDQNVDLKDVKCYNCSENGHYKSDCKKPRRITGSCFKCGELGHFHQSCPKNKKTVAVINEEPNIPFSHVNTQVLNPYQEVSVAFTNLTGDRIFTTYLSLLDTGSPLSFMRKKDIPYSISCNPRNTSLRGIGDFQIEILNTILCEVTLLNTKIQHVFYVIPDNYINIPILIGRDLLLKLNISLCKFKYNYSNEMLKNFQCRVEENINDDLKNAIMKLDIEENKHDKVYTNPYFDNKRLKYI